MADMRYPARIDGVMQDNLSRWLWLVKWLLIIPHVIVLTFLAIGFFVTTVIAFFAILFAGRYPRGLFDFNVSVIRWGWRVAFYSYNALGTDEYPPFTLEDVEYPARIEIDYPEQLSRGLVLVKWWLLAIPHLLIVGVFSSGLIWTTTELAEDGAYLEIGGGLIGLLVFIAGIILLFTGQYPRGLYDFIMGMNRWVLRTLAYVALMTDEYPPFRFDSGGTDPGSTQQAPNTA